MRGWILAGALASTGLLLSAGMVFQPVHAEGEAAGRGVHVAVIDVHKALKGYNKFNTLNEELKASIEAKEAELRDIEQGIRSRIQSGQQLTNQKDRDRIEKEIADLKFEFEKKKRDYQMEFLRREADIYSSVYSELTDVVEAIAQHNGIHMVLRLKEEAEVNNPQAVLQTISREVVYSHPNLNITEHVVAELNQRLQTK